MLDQIWEVVQKYFVPLGVFSAIGSLIGLYFKNRIESRTSVQLANHKADLDATLEKAKTSLSMERLEHEVRFRKLHDEMSGVIIELFRRINEVYQNMLSFIHIAEYNGEPDKQGKYKILIESLRKAQDYCLKERLFIPKNVFDLTLKFINDVDGMTSEFKRSYDAQQAGDYKENLAYWTKSHNEGKAISDRFQMLYAELQKLLGIRT